MPRTLKGLETSWNADVYMGMQAIAPPAVTVGAGATNGTVQGNPLVAPFNFKIRKIAYYFTAIDNITGTDSFNIVVGTAAYTQGNAAQNDNSEVNTAALGAQPTGGFGYPTNVATVGQTVFAADVPFNVANFPNIATGTGGYGILIPTNDDAVYPAGIPLTLRVTTVAGTGSLTAFQLRFGVVPIPLRKGPTPGEVTYPQPLFDY